MNAHTSCGDLLYEDNVPNRKLVVGGRSQCILPKFERAARKTFGPHRRSLSPPETGQILLSNLYCGVTEGSNVSQANREPVGDVVTEENCSHSPVEVCCRHEGVDS